MSLIAELGNQSITLCGSLFKLLPEIDEMIPQMIYKERPPGEKGFNERLRGMHFWCS